GIRSSESSHPWTRLSPQSCEASMTIPYNEIQPFLPAPRKMATATEAAYRTDIKAVEKFCITAVPPAATTLVKFLEHEVVLRRISPRTLRRRLASIADAHRRAGQPSPTDNPMVLATLRYL